MPAITGQLKKFYRRCQSLQPQINIDENTPSRTSPVTSPLIDSLIPEANGAVHIIHGVDIAGKNSKNRHAHHTFLYKKQGYDGSWYGAIVLDDERHLGKELTQYYFVLSSVGLGGFEKLPLKKLMKFLEVKTINQKKISYSDRGFNDKNLSLDICNDSLEFNKWSLIDRWIQPDFGFDNLYDNNISDFKPNGRPVLAIIKTLNGRDFIRVRPPELLVAIRDDAEVTLAEKYQQYLQKEMER